MYIVVQLVNSVPAVSASHTSAGSNSIVPLSNQLLVNAPRKVALDGAMTWALHSQMEFQALAISVCHGHLGNRRHFCI